MDVFSERVYCESIARGVCCLIRGRGDEGVVAIPLTACVVVSNSHSWRCCSNADICSC